MARDVSDPYAQPCSSIDTVVGQILGLKDTRCTEEETLCKVPPAATTVPRVNNFHVLLWVLRGKALVEIGTRVFIISKGEAIWLPACICNRIRTQDGGIVVPVGQLAAQYDLPRDKILPIQFPSSQAPEMLYRSVASYTLLQPYPHDTYHMVDLFYSDQCGRLRRDSPPETISRILESPFSNTRTMCDWADELGIPKNNLARRFHSWTGLSYRRWQLNRRMTYARALLARTGMTSTRISFELGYSHPGAFTRAFSRYLKQTPTKFRRNFQHLRHIITTDNYGVTDSSAESNPFDDTYERI